MTDEIVSAVLSPEETKEFSNNQFVQFVQFNLFACAKNANLSNILMYRVHQCRVK